MLSRTEREAQLAAYYRNPRPCAVCGATLGALSVSLNDAQVCANYTCRNESKKQKGEAPPGWRLFRSEHNKRLAAELEAMRAERELLKKLFDSALARK